ncbi:hypothetical protein [Pseudarthrobacter sulfonivorans]|uniref:hypothetical protein n=1 Tax=Pseudarthrobacter sulfonivorans TaxID=121292 RepID=UPI0021066B9D|nr:hypothetical protein [Pseudarthrobacter sulfonivorans]
MILRAAVMAMCAVNVAGMGLVLGGIAGWSTLAHLFLTQASVGFIMGNATALAQGAVPGRAGAGSAVLGLIQFLLGGLVSPLTGIAGEHSAVPMAVSMAACSVLAVAAAAAGSRLSRPKC